MDESDWEFFPVRSVKILPCGFLVSHDVLESSDAILIPKPLKTTCFEACREVAPNLFGIRDWFHGRQFFPGLGRVGMAFVSLISCRAAQFLTDHGQVAIHGPGGWGPLLS